jgi:TRAP transporter TAXI family solute receptor
MDLRKRRVSTGAPNSGTEEQADFVLKGLGIDWNRDITREKLGASESVAALKDGKIDAFFWSGAVPTSSIIDLSSTPGLKMVLLPVGGETAEKIIQANPPVVFHKTVFRKGAYSALDADVETLAITAVLNAMESFPADTLYQILAAIFGNTKEISAVWKGALQLTPEKSIAQMTPEAIRFLHPGAQRFFKEKGGLK